MDMCIRGIDFASVSVISDWIVKLLWRWFIFCLYVFHL